MNKTKTAILCMLVLAGSSLLAACGNKGPLYTTTEKEAEAAKAAIQENAQKAEEKKK